MKVLKVDDLQKTDRDVQFTGGNSLRPILESDNMGFTFCKTFIPKGGPHRWHYKNHKECCYCISGMGIITNRSTGESWGVLPDTLYILDKHEDHTFEALEDTILISIFNPPLTGKETHDENGNYGTN